MQLQNSIFPLDLKNSTFQKKVR